MLDGFRPPVRLEGKYLELVPLEPRYAAGLAAAAQTPEIWKYLRYGPCSTEATMLGLIDTFLVRQEAGTDLPFAILERSGGAPVGMTRFLEIDRPNHCAEVGGTWFDRRYWRTPLNTESKLLMLGHAFDTERVNRVQLKTDLRNIRSQRAIERIGALREGILRDHVILPDGYVRSSVVYSIVRREWPAVKVHLGKLLELPWAVSTALHP